MMQRYIPFLPLDNVLRGTSYLSSLDRGFDVLIVLRLPLIDLFRCVGLACVGFSVYWIRLDEIACCVKKAH